MSIFRAFLACFRRAMRLRDDFRTKNYQFVGRPSRLASRPRLGITILAYISMPVRASMEITEAIVEFAYARESKIGTHSATSSARVREGGPIACCTRRRFRLHPKPKLRNGSRFHLRSNSGLHHGHRDHSRRRVWGALGACLWFVALRKLSRSGENTQG